MKEQSKIFYKNRDLLAEGQSKTTVKELFLTRARTLLHFVLVANQLCFTF